MDNDNVNVDALIAQWTKLAEQNNNLAAKLVHLFDETNVVQSEKRRAEADLFEAQRAILEYRNTEFPFVVTLNTVDPYFGIPLPHMAYTPEIDAFIDENGGCDVFGTKSVMRFGHNKFFFKDARTATEFKLRFG